MFPWNCITTTKNTHNEAITDGLTHCVPYLPSFESFGHLPALLSCYDVHMRKYSCISPLPSVRVVSTNKQSHFHVQRTNRGLGKLKLLSLCCFWPKLDQIFPHICGNCLPHHFRARTFCHLSGDDPVHSGFRKAFVFSPMINPHIGVVHEQADDLYLGHC